MPFTEEGRNLFEENMRILDEARRQGEREWRPPRGDFRSSVFGPNGCFTGNNGRVRYPDAIEATCVEVKPHPAWPGLWVQIWVEERLALTVLRPKSFTDLGGMS